MKKTSMSNPVKSLGYLKCYSLSNPEPVKRTDNSIRDNCKKIRSWSRRPKSILEIIYKFKDFTNHRKKANRAEVFSIRHFPNILQYRDYRWDLANKTLSGKYWRVHLVCMKCQAHRLTERPLEHNQDQTPLLNQGLLWPF